MTHAAFSGNIELVEWLVAKGASTGISSALHNMVNRGYTEIVGWLLANSKPDLSWKNFQGKTALAVALENQNQTIVQLLQAHGAVAESTP